MNKAVVGTPKLLIPNIIHADIILLCRMLFNTVVISMYLSVKEFGDWYTVVLGDLGR